MNNYIHTRATDNIMATTMECQTKSLQSLCDSDEKRWGEGGDRESAKSPFVYIEVELISAKC